MSKRENACADQTYDLALVIAQHHRIDPMTSTDRCTCGYKAQLGQLFTKHIAQVIVDRWQMTDPRTKTKENPV